VHRRSAATVAGLFQAQDYPKRLCMMGVDYREETGRVSFGFQVLHAETKNKELLMIVVPPHAGQRAGPCLKFETVAN